VIVNCLLGTANGDAARNRSPFVRFTITDPETQQITAAGQIPLNNTPPNTQTSNSLTSSKYIFFILSFYMYALLETFFNIIYT